MDTLHIKIDSEVNEELKRLGKTRGISVSDLIRQALFLCYQLDMQGLSLRQKQAIEAYRGGFISIGKLSELMGRSILETRNWLNDHKIVQNSTFSEEDVENAK